MHHLSKLINFQVSSETLNLGQTIKKAQEREQDYSHVMTELQRTRENERKLIQEKEQLIVEAKRLENLIYNDKHQFEGVNQQKQELMYEFKELKSNLEETRQSEHKLKNESIRLQEKLNNNEIMNSDLKDLLSKEQKKNGHLQ